MTKLNTSCKILGGNETNHTCNEVVAKICLEFGGNKECATDVLAKHKVDTPEKVEKVADVKDSKIN